MLKTIVNYVNYHYQLCENIDHPFLSKDEKANECYIKSCLIYKYLHELFIRKDITLMEIMVEMYGALIRTKSSSYKMNNMKRTQIKRKSVKKYQNSKK